MQLYAITDRNQYAASGEGGLNPALLRQVDGWAAGGVRYIQVREKDLAIAELAALITQIKARLPSRSTQLLVNLPSPALAAVAKQSGADGVHLAGKLIPGAAAAVRQVFRSAGADAIISMPCHSLEEVALARKEQANLILFSPVFEKGTAPAHGLGQLRLACAQAQPVPVFALGGANAENAAACYAAGAAGIAGIRLFAADGWRRLAAQTWPREPYIVE